MNKINQHELNKHLFINDIADFKIVEIEGQIYYFNEFLSIGIMKKILIFKWEIINQYPEFYDADNGTKYLNITLLKYIGNKLIMMWILMVDKCNKILIEVSLKFSITAHRQINLFKLKKLIKKECGLGKDMIFTVMI
jgi:hypothetical protein